jgi:ribosomal protein RSM22 (predicted rRNA methylase)
MRMTIPRSQGKQPYYDARKSGWGDIFPHPPKNSAQERHLAPKLKENPRSPTDDQTSKKGNRDVPGHDKKSKKQHL